MKKFFPIIVFTIVILLAVVFYLCQDSPQIVTLVDDIDQTIKRLNCAYETKFNITPQAEKKRTMKILLDGQTEFSFVKPPKYDGILWLPASEVMHLFDYRGITFDGTHVGCGHYDEQGNYQFAFFQAGSFGYATDADNTKEYSTAFKKPYYEDGEVFVPETSMETLTGDVFSYDAETNTLTIVHEKATALQQNNHNPLRKIVPKASNELNNNRIFQSINPLYEYVDYWKPENFADPQDRFSGWKWLNITLETPNWQESRLELPDFYTNEDFECFFQTVDDYGLYLSYDLTYKDKDFKRSGGSIDQSNLHDPAQVERYLAFVEEVVNHYQGVVDDYQLWNEPNAIDQPSYVAVDDYLAVLQRAAPLIRRIDPQATISIGYPCPDYEDMSWPYLEALVSSEAVRLADHIAVQPFQFISPERFPDFYYNYPQRVGEIMMKARQNGFEGDFWMSGGDYTPREYGLAVVDNFNTYTEVLAVKYLQRINAINLGIGLSGGTMGTLESPLSKDALSRSALLFSGVQPAGYRIAIQSDLTPVRSYSYDVDMGKLFSYWYDSTASEENLSGHADIQLDVPDCQHVYAYDILPGFYQELDYQFCDGKIMLDDVIIQDYPMFILVN